jgi:cytochrome c2
VFVYQDLPWRLPLRQLYVTAVIIGGYLVISLITLGASYRGMVLTPRERMLANLAMLAVVYLSFFAALPNNVDVSKAVILATFTLLISSVALDVSPPPVKRIAMFGLTTVLLACGGTAVFLYAGKETPDYTIRESSIRTSLTTITTRVYLDFLPRPWTKGGALARVHDDILLTTGDGSMYLVQEQDEEPWLTVKALPQQVPLNLQSFKEGALKGTNFNGFRTSDAIVQERSDSISVFSAHHYWHSENKCYVVRVSRLDSSFEQLIAPDANTEWQTVFDSQPCLTLRTTTTPFSGLMIGGRITFLDDETLIISLGDQGYDGYSALPDYPQNDDVDYGKLIRLNLTTGQASTLSKGHRNPQGLIVSSDQKIWSTEHGPEGGDELNLIRNGANYGWPEVTYGTGYGLDTWPPSDNPGRHVGFEPPVFSWVPSIGISDLTEVQSDLFPMWKGDLLIGSLTDSVLHRVRLQNDRPVVIEPIYFGERLRDVIQAPSGKIVLWTDSGRLITVEPSTALTGRELYEQRCSSCHRLGNGQTHGIGPDLTTVYGRDIATALGYDYSDALAELDGTWTKSALDQFLKDPSSMAPGTRMASEYANLEDDTSRQLIIEFLATLE